MRARASSFATAAQAHLTEIKPVFALSSYRTKESCIRKHLSPRFDGRPMRGFGVRKIRPLPGLAAHYGGGCDLIPHWSSKGFTTPDRLLPFFQVRVRRTFPSGQPCPDPQRSERLCCVQEMGRRLHLVKRATKWILK